MRGSGAADRRRAVTLSRLPLYLSAIAASQLLALLLALH
jgi:hypothetical protein